VASSGVKLGMNGSQHLLILAAVVSPFFFSLSLLIQFEGTGQRQQMK